MAKEFPVEKARQESVKKHRNSTSVFAGATEYANRFQPPADSRGALSMKFDPPFEGGFETPPIDGPSERLFWWMFLRRLKYEDVFLYDITNCNARLEALGERVVVISVAEGDLFSKFKIGDNLTTFEAVATFVLGRSARVVLIELG